MSEVHVYVEGGGKGGASTAVRMGFVEFLKDACSPECRLRVVPCGARNEARKVFEKAISDPVDGFCILLVDAEGPVRAGATAKDHLGWSLAGVDEDHVHLMVQTFEAWVVADENAIAEFYGQGFDRNALPQHANLEAVSKDDLDDALARATRGTKNRTYHKIRHGPSILAKANAATVSGRCASCAKLFEVLAGV